MSKFIILTFDVLFDEVILTLVSENDVNFFGRIATDIRSEHNIIFRISVHIFGSDI